MPYFRRMWRSRGGRRKKYSHFFGESRFLTIFAVTKVVNIGFYEIFRAGIPTIFNCGMKARFFC